MRSPGDSSSLSLAAASVRERRRSCFRSGHFEVRARQGLRLLSRGAIVASLEGNYEGHDVYVVRDEERMPLYMSGSLSRLCICICGRKICRVRVGALEIVRRD